MKAARAKLSLPAPRGRDAHQPRAEAVDRGRAQRLAAQRALEEERTAPTISAIEAAKMTSLAGERERPEREARVPEARVAKALGAEEDQAEAGEREVHADRDDQQHQHASRRRAAGRRAGRRAGRAAVTMRQREQRSAPSSGSLSGAAQTVSAATTTGAASVRSRPRAIAAGAGRGAQRVDGVEQRRHDGEHQQQPDRARHLAELQHAPASARRRRRTRPAG